MTLYLKYRPQLFNELDLESVRAAFTKLIDSGEAPHAYLFAGPRGAGKTSAARILAKALNCEKNKGKLAEPCNKCAHCKAITSGSHIDIVEMDAASNRGIDDIRALKENIALAPGFGRKKIYIMDEAHMLTTEAANALLKTLEEPPPHVVFILATTDPQKLPVTVRSRLTNIQFSKANSAEIKRQLGRVAKAEDLKIEEGAIKLIAKAADGSFRDAVKLVEDLSNESKNITKEMAKKAIFTNANFNPEELLDAILAKNLNKSLIAIENLVQAGTHPKLITDELLNLIHASLLDNLNSPDSDKLSLAESLIIARDRVSQAGIAQLPLEIELVKWIGTKPQPSKKKSKSPSPRPPAQAGKRESIQKRESTQKQKSTKKPNPSSQPAPSFPRKRESAQKSLPQELNDLTWAKILTKMRDTDTKVEALLRASEPLGIAENKLNIGVYYRFHKERLEVVQTREICEDVVNSILGKQLKIAFALTEKKPPTKKQLDKETKSTSLTATGEEDIIQAAKEIFGN